MGRGVSWGVGIGRAVWPPRSYVGSGKGAAVEEWRRHG